MLYNELGYLICVAILWGVTNPFVKRGSKGIEKVKADSYIVQFILELKYLISNVSYILPMLLNQLGSVIYFLTLQHTNISLAVPVANSLTFIFTALTGWMIRERTPSKNTFIGIVLILIGTSLCCYDNYRATPLKSSKAIIT